MKRVRVVEQKETITAERFHREFVCTCTPVVLRGYARQWSAVQYWTPSFFSEQFGGAVVEVSSNNEERETTHKKQVTLEEYVQALENGKGKEFVGYLKQYDLFEACPRLKECVNFSSLFPGPWAYGTPWSWLGPRGAITSLHNDDENNLLAQIYGRKRAVLYSPDDRCHLYPNSKYDCGTECCDVDVGKPDLQLHPKFAKAQAYEVILEPGDVLFIPIFWYHYVETVSTSISINYFVSTPFELARFGLVRSILWVLHVLGVYRRRDCVCHAAPAVHDAATPAPAAM
jgi:lysine-specific demethylase 8